MLTFGLVSVFASATHANAQRPRKIFIHVNNTNPILDEDSDEYHQVREAGWEVAQDGWEFDL